ncbi:hypothetical protein, partial [Aeromonas media]|uniref:hypothetical protein n=1 Tax=Aeromonas media TaxID=651 RepID=UPI00190F2AFD
MDSAYLKVKRAEKHYAELAQMFKKKKPFGYFLETNCKTGERATFAKRNEDVANEAREFNFEVQFPIKNQAAFRSSS